MWIVSHGTGKARTDLGKVATEEEAIALGNELPAGSTFHVRGFVGSKRIRKTLKSTGPVRGISQVMVGELEGFSF